MLLRVLPLLIALALSLAPSSQAAVFVAAPPASAPPSTSENACTAFLPNESESRIGLLCHNDPVNRLDPFGLQDIRIELRKTGDRNQHVDEIIGKLGNKLSGKTEAEFKVNAAEKQKDGSEVVVGEMKVNVKYADGPNSTAGPKTRAETAKLEPEHAKIFDRFYDRAQKTVDALNRTYKFDSGGAAQRALEGSGLQRKFNEAYAESLRLDKPVIYGGTGAHLLPFRYEE